MKTGTGLAASRLATRKSDCDSQGNDDSEPVGAVGLRLAAKGLQGVIQPLIGPAEALKELVEGPFLFRHLKILETEPALLQAPECGQ